MSMAFIGVPIHYCHLSAFFNLWKTKNKRRKKAANMFLYVLFYVIGRFAAYYPLLVPSLIFHDEYKI
jgi:hypothetical protein